MVHRTLALLWLVLAAPALALAPPPDLARLVGERLEFRIRWGVIPAGTAYLEVLPDTGGRLRFRARAQTLPLLDRIYPVQDLVESTVLAAEHRVLRYYKKAKEGWGRAREDEVLFDPGAGTARFFKDGEARRTLNVPPGVQDPLSCFYWYRTRPVVDDRPVSLDVTDGSKLITGTVTVLGRETVETPAGSFQTVLVEPRIEGIGGIFKKSPGARILVWLTDDSWRRPVKLQSKVIVGHFTAELTKIW
ncbi:MAG: DUF3108 domain-containing protein [Deltaproteobacteria bacterium]|nr:DUF3108 domain-containing protein [Deltaproteobacteria bacterium]